MSKMNDFNSKMSNSNMKSIRIISKMNRPNNRKDNKNRDIKIRSTIMRINSKNFMRRIIKSRITIILLIKENFHSVRKISNKELDNTKRLNPMKALYNNSKIIIDILKNPLITRHLSIDITRSKHINRINFILVGMKLILQNPEKV